MKRMSRLTEDNRTKCHVFDGVHIPGCYGCANYDHRRCDCGTGARSGGEGAYVMREVEAEYRRAHAPRNGIRAPAIGWQDPPPLRPLA